MKLSPRTKLRLLGFLPLIFFLAQGVHYWQRNELGHMLWMCNIGNLLLAMGLFLEKPVVVRLAAIWTIPGLVIWILYVVLVWTVFPSSVLAHVGGLVVALMALSRYGMDRISWRWALGWYLMVQLASRFITPPALNVNLAHAIQPGWEQTFHSYWSFWLVLTLFTILSVWLSGLVLWRIWPVNGSPIARIGSITSPYDSSDDEIRSMR
ncbi:MAG TPA: hypothetical protein VHS05_08485 [Pyrinomonadaceae bacterium]|jgi:hypothetical protein|nr:hypothetical protein [Pyrinomonadaceae bacterium]